MNDKVKTNKDAPLAVDLQRGVMAYDHSNHYANCASCGWTGDESELPRDPDGHSCGKDECPECGAESNITCCYLSYDGAEAQDETDRDGYEAGP